jgi:SecD/SecF fusion protein
MKPFFWKIIICVVPVLASIAVIAEAWANERFKLGVDLVGGTILVYEVDDESKLPQGYKPEDLASSLKRRIDPNDLYNVTIRPVGRTRVEIILPTGAAGDERHKAATAEEVQNIKKLISQVGSLEFRMLANSKDDEPALKKAREWIEDPANAERLQQFAKEGKAPPGPVTETGEKEIFTLPEDRGRVSYSWIELGRQERHQLGFDNAAELDTRAPERGGFPRSFYWQQPATLRESTNEALIRFRDAVDPEPLAKELNQRLETDVKKEPGQPAPKVELTDAKDKTKKDGPFAAMRVTVNRPVEKTTLRAAIEKACTELKVGPPTAIELKSNVYQLPRGLLSGDILYSRRCENIHLSDKERAEKKYEYFVLGRDPQLDSSGEPKRIIGKYLTNAVEGVDQKMQPAVNFTFDTTGSNLFYELTSKNVPTGQGENQVRRHLAILLDDQIVSAPTINSAISSNGQITGFKKKEVGELVRILRAGALPATLKGQPVSENTMGPTLGRDTIINGTRSVLIAFACILIFMIVYYRFAGLVASVALLANLVLTVGFMAAVNATFTLPGLAGLVLMLGMAVDANVLIYERLREERDRGASLALAIRNGYDRAFAVIIDTHLSSIFTAIVLYAVGNDQLKGFGISLTVGLIISLFTSLYMTRLLFDIWLSRSWLHKLSMFRLFSRPNIDFMRIRYVMFAATVFMSLFGITVFLIRGKEGLNIDFIGGTAYGGQLNQYASIEDLRRWLGDEQQKALLNVPLSGVKQLDTEGRAFEITYSDGEKRKIELPNAATEQEVQRRASTLPDLSVEQIFLRDAEFTQGGESKLFTVRTSEKAPDLVQVSITRLLSHTPDKGDVLWKIEMQDFKVGDPGAPMTKTATMSFIDPAKINPDTKKPEAAYASPAQVSMLLERELRAHDLGAHATRFSVGKVSDQQPDKDGRLSEMKVEFTEPVDRSKLEQALAATKVEFANRPQPERLENFDSQLAAETQMRAMYAILASWAAILLYLWFRFGSWTFGLAAVLCLIHDLFFTMGVIAFSHWLHVIPGVGRFLLLEDFKIDLPAVAALLTLVGYSVNDTIVVFDRIREVRGKNPELTPQMINDSVNQTLSRTLLTSFATWLVVIVLYIFGGEGVHLFSFCMVIGVIVGTYSSIYIASPLLLIFGEGKRPAGARERLPQPAPEPVGVS